MAANIEISKLPAFTNKSRIKQVQFLLRNFYQNLWLVKYLSIWQERPQKCLSSLYIRRVVIRKWEERVDHLHEGFSCGKYYKRFWSNPYKMKIQANGSNSHSIFLVWYCGASVNGLIQWKYCVEYINTGKSLSQALERDYYELSPRICSYELIR